jgi:hypothetical protein
VRNSYHVTRVLVCQYHRLKLCDLLRARITRILPFSTATSHKFHRHIILGRGSVLESDHSPRLLPWRLRECWRSHSIRPRGCCSRGWPAISLRLTAAVPPGFLRRFVGEGSFNREDRQAAMKFALRNAGVDSVTVGHKNMAEINEHRESKSRSRVVD